MPVQELCKQQARPEALPQISTSCSTPTAIIGSIYQGRENLHSRRCNKYIFMNINQGYVMVLFTFLILTVEHV